MKHSCPPHVFIFVFLLSLGINALPLTAATVSWDGGAGTSYWDDAANWSSDSLPGSDDDVVIGVNTSLNASRRLDVNTNATFQSYTGSVANLMTRASGGSRTLTIGSSDTGNASSITLNLNRSVSDDSFTGTGSNILYIEFGYQITLTHTGSGETTFGQARLRNTSTSTGTDTVFFAGSGNWAFVTPSSGVASALQKNSANATLDVELKSGTGGFTGTLRYASTNAMNVDNVRVNGGTLFLDSSVITTTGTSETTGLTVGSEGTFIGNGTVNGSATINGVLSVGTTTDSTGLMTFNNGLTLQSSAQTWMDITGLAAGSFDSITVAGVLGLDGNLILTLTGSYQVGDSWALFTGFSETSGDFSTVTLNGVTLEKSGDLWTGSVGGSFYELNESTGLLAVAVPEPGITALMIFSGLGMFVFQIRRCKRNRVF